MKKQNNELIGYTDNNNGEKKDKDRITTIIDNSSELLGIRNVEKSLSLAKENIGSLWHDVCNLNIRSGTSQSKKDVAVSMAAVFISSLQLLDILGITREEFLNKVLEEQNKQLVKERI